MNEEILNYYNNLAGNYDESRFGNEYGEFIAIQETNLLKRLLSNVSQKKVLDIGCGTGRFLEFAGYGIDASPEMLKVAKIKYPNHNLFVEDAANTHFEDSFFDIVISFHLLMHLDEPTTRLILDEAYRILKKGGKLIFDVPSEKRRKIIHYKATSWHGANAFSVKNIIELTRNHWKLINYYGIVFFPVHRVSPKLRKRIITLDTKLCNSFLKEYASYLVFYLEKI
jgi:ubiquinone/menaquinone biosynthesis C-methylase UbiE